MKRSVLVLLAALFGVSFAILSPDLDKHIAGAPQDQLLPVHVVLTEQFDSDLLNQLVDGMPKPQRRMEVARILRQFSAEKQADLLGYLADRVAAGQARNVEPLWILNAVAFEATPEVIKVVSVMTGVNYVDYDLKYSPGLLEPEEPVTETDEITYGVNNIQAPAVWALGYTGQGVVCGHIDTGCNYNHTDLADHMWTDANYPNHGWNFESNNNDPNDIQGHGTHTAGTVASDGTGGTQCGVAPDAQMMICRVRTQADSIAEAQCWAAMQFCVAPPLSPANGADLYTMSLGWVLSWNPAQASWRTTANNVMAAGVSQIVAAGNERSTSPPNSCRCPGNVPPPWPNPENTGTGALSGIVSIGAVDSSDAIASFSSRGPVTWGTVSPFNDWAYPPGLTRPDVCAPGVNTKSCSRTGGYTSMSGTSMATPHTAGAVCLMLSKNPNLLPREVDSILEVTSLDLGPAGKDNDFGAGRINALAAVNATRPPFGIRYYTHVVDDSIGGNDDGIINPGEAINMPTWVMNLCDYTVRGVWATLRTADANITITDSLKRFGTILQDSASYTGADGFNFTVAAACTNRYSLDFDLVLTDTLDSTYVSSLSLLVGTPKLAGDSTYAYDGGNGKLDPGEECDIAVQLINFGLGNAYGVSAVLISGDARMTVIDANANYGFVPADSWAMNTADHFRVNAGAAIPREFVIPCTLRVTQTGYPVQSVPFGIEVGRLTAVDPIPDGPRTPALYYAYDNADSTYDEAPDFSWVEIRNLGTRLTLTDDQTVTVPLPTGFGPWVFYGQAYTQVAICGNGWIAPGTTTTSAYTNTALPTTTVAVPAVFINWDDLYPPTGGGVWWYHDAANHRFIVEWDSVAYYSARTTFDKNQVIIYDTTMAALDGNNEIVFQYLTANQTNSATVGEQDPTRAIAIQALYNGAYHRASAAIEAGRAIKFTTDGPVTGVAEPPSAARVGRLSLAPSANPFVNSVSLRYTLPATTPVKLVVYDATGRVVRELVDTGSDEQPAGSYTIRWNGTDAAGRRLAAGVYLYRLETAVGNIARKAVLSR
ncbi:MAG: S8 family serine peptidase [bacterium]